MTRDGPWALLEVQDNGRGIEPSFLGQVFDMFRQGDHKPTTRREGGMRIGLALVKRLAELHGGSVEADSEGPGKGAVFKVRLPLLEGTFGSKEPGFQLVSRRALAGQRWRGTEAWAKTLEGLRRVDASSARRPCAPSRRVKTPRVFADKMRVKPCSRGR